jgi:hypothetical protein
LKGDAAMKVLSKIVGFRVKADTLTYVERQPPAKTSNPFTTPEPTLDAEAVLERIDIVRRQGHDERLQLRALDQQGLPRRQWVLLKVVEILIFNLKSGCYAVGDMAKDRKKAAAPEPPIMPEDFTGAKLIEDSGPFMLHLTQGTKIPQRIHTSL